jgi:hypothetical protein
VEGNLTGTNARRGKLLNNKKKHHAILKKAFTFFIKLYVLRGQSCSYENIREK